jgi:uncharacterized protein with HEPN domain
MKVYLNCKGGTENNQIKFIKNAKDIHSLELIESYVEPIFYEKDQCLKKFVVQIALQVIGECTADDSKEVKTEKHK